MGLVRKIKTRRAIAKRNAMLMRGDLQELAAYMRKQSGKAPNSMSVVEAALHKARLECSHLPDQMRRESANWLLYRGLSRITNEPVPLPDEPLPK